MSFTVQVKSSSLMVGPAAAFENFGSVVTLDLSVPTEQNIELLGLLKACLDLTDCMAAGVENRVNALLVKMGVVPSEADTPQEYRIISAALPFPLELLLRPRAAGG